MIRIIKIKNTDKEIYINRDKIEEEPEEKLMEQVVVMGETEFLDELEDRVEEEYMGKYLKKEIKDGK